ncbi:MAG: hypothetical protein ABJN40_09515 [Sneathiella sp.]
MPDAKKSTINIKDQVASNLSGEKGFGNSKKMRKMGIDAYKDHLSGQIAKKAVQQQADPRRRKRLERKPFKAR